MQEKGSEIADNSIDLVLTDPPYNEESIPLYGELAETSATSIETRRQSYHDNRPLRTIQDRQTDYR